MTWYKPWTWGDDPAGKTQNADSRGLLGENGGHAGAFANSTAGNYGQGTAALNDATNALRDQAQGRNLVAPEVLRQALMSNVAAQH